MKNIIEENNYSILLDLFEKDHNYLSSALAELNEMNKHDILNYTHIKTGSQTIQLLLDKYNEIISNKTSKTNKSSEDTKDTRDTNIMLTAMFKNITNNEIERYALKVIDILFQVSTELFQNQFSSFTFQKLIIYFSLKQRIEIWFHIESKIVKISNHKIANRCIQALIRNIENTSESKTVLSMFLNFNRNHMLTSSIHYDNWRELSEINDYKKNNNADLIKNFLSITNNEFGYFVILELLDKLYNMSIIKYFNTNTNKNTKDAYSYIHCYDNPISNDSYYKANLMLFVVLAKIISILERIIGNRFGASVFKRAIEILEIKDNELYILSNNSLLKSNSNVSSSNKVFIELVVNMKKEVLERTTLSLNNILKNKYGYYSIVRILDNFKISNCLEIVNEILINIDVYSISSFSFKILKKIINSTDKKVR